MLVLDFSFYLLLGVLITGGIWLLDYWVLAPKRVLSLRQESDSLGSEEVQTKQQPKEPTVVEYAKSFFPVLLIVFLLRGFIVEPFKIPSGSMLPSLYIGDFILVNKFAYGVKLPVANIKILDVGTPKRGDVIVFRYPKDPSLDYIKRVIGLPGDRIAYYNKMLYVNGKQVSSQYVGQYEGPDQPRAQEYMEVIDDVEHEILLMPGPNSVVEGEYRVPDGMFFVMGDNRDNSSDSRRWGYVPEENLVGRAFMIWMHIKDWDVRWSRIGNMID